jgi:hypothetical protein
MSSSSIQQLVDDWIAYHQLTGDERDRSALRFAEREVSNLARSDPARCMRIIAEVLRRDTSDSTMAGLAAGPLEDLFLEHGQEAVRLFEHYAAMTPDLDRLLGGVWDGDFAPEVSTWLTGRRRSRW